MTASASASSSRPRYAPEDPTLPKPWKALVDGSTGYLYFWNPETNVTQYERPVTELPPPPPLLPPPPPHPPPKSASVAVSSSVLHNQRKRERERERERDSHDDDGRHGHSRSSHQHGGARGSSSQNHGHDARDSRTASARVHGSSSDGGGALSAVAYRRQHEIIVTVCAK